MPPPPLPSFSSFLPLPSTAQLEVTSPTASFANLSLLSPLVNGPSPHFPGSFRSASASRSSASASPAPPSAEESPVLKSPSPVVHPKLSALVTSPVLPRAEAAAVLPEALSRRESVVPLEDPTPPERAPSPPPPIQSAPEPETMHVEPFEQSSLETAPPADDPGGLFDTDEMVTDAAAMVVDAEELRIEVQSPVPPVQEREESAGKDDTSVEERTSPVSPAPPPSPSPTPSHEPATAAPEPDAAVVAEDIDAAMALALDVENHPATASPDGSAAIAADPVQDADTAKADGENEPQGSPVVEASPPVTQPPAPHKVKMSFKDFAMRKKRQREEEEKAHPSPVVPAAPLGEHHTEQAQADPAQDEHPQESPSEAQPVSSVQPEVHQASPPVDEARPLETKASSPEISSAAEAPVEHPESTHTVTDPRTNRNRAPSPKTVPEAESHEISDASLQAKVELIETPALSLPSIREPSPSSPSPRSSTFRSPRSPRPRSPSLTPTPPSSRNKKENEPVMPLASAQVPLQILNRLSRQLSQEDGEILSPPAPKAPPLAPPSGPRAHSPPTHPRGFHSHMGGVSPSRPPPRRPLQPPSFRPQLNMPLSSRPLPSGPRALRGANGGSHYSGPAAGGPHLAPRAPSADRDRERMDWERDRGRVGSWGRGRPTWR